MKHKFNFLKLKYLIKTKFNKQEDLANILNISTTALNNKLNNRVPFNYEEMYLLINLLDIKPEEINEVFFTLES